MVGWGGAPGLINPPGMGPVKPGYGRVLTFALDGNASMEPRPFGHTEPPVPALPLEASAATIRDGQELYEGLCFGCHGFGTIAGSLPDLRYSSADVHAQFEQIVLGGLREQRGMPRFDDLIDAEEVRAIQQYILSRSHATSGAP